MFFFDHSSLNLIAFAINPIVGLGALVLLRVVGVARTCRRNEADVFAHGSGVLSREFGPRNSIAWNVEARFAGFVPANGHHAR